MPGTMLSTNESLVKKKRKDEKTVSVELGSRGIDGQKSNDQKSECGVTTVIRAMIGTSMIVAQDPASLG